MPTRLPRLAAFSFCTATLAALGLSAWHAMHPTPAQAHFQDLRMEPIVNAPDFPKDFAWLNTDRPLSLKTDLKGHVVLLDFWTYCCINCMHLIPDLEYFEQKYKDQPFIVIGVHSAKYDNEEDAANIRAAIQRYEVHHPVIVDQDHKIWDSYAVSAWPTQILVGPDGKIIGGLSGEGHRATFDRNIAKALEDGRAKNLLSKEPLKLAREGQVRAASGLSFPGKIIPDPQNARLFIVDSNHHRIIITSYPSADGHAAVKEIIGTGKQGAADGTFAQASFYRPQGAALSGTTLWIADTENHLIRRVDLERKTVATVLGTGKQVFDREAGKTGKAQGLNSPWDVAVGNNRLYIANAGQHQLFSMNIMTGMTEIAAGSGRENIRDDIAADAQLAQPSGLALDAKNQLLYFADSEVSALRALDIKNARVDTLIGRGLFEFGDKDGNFTTAILQHPIGVALDPNGNIFLADTYNHKIKFIDVDAETSKTLAGTGKVGTGTADTPQFFEPASIALGTPNELFVADTNNHRIVRLTLANGKLAGWKELTIDGLASPDTAADMLTDKDANDLGTRPLPQSDLTLQLAVTLPAAHHFTPAAPISLKITDGTRILHTTSLSAPTTPTSTLLASKNTLIATIPASILAAKPTQLHIMLYYTHCSEGPSAVCIPAKASWKLAPTYAAGAAATLPLATQ